MRNLTAGPRTDGPPLSSPAVTQNAEEPGIPPSLIPLPPSRSGSPSQQIPTAASIVGDEGRPPAGGEGVGEKGSNFCASKPQHASSWAAAETQLLLRHERRWNPKNTLFQRVPPPPPQQQQQQQQWWESFLQEVRESYSSLYDLVAVLLVVMVLVYMDPDPLTNSGGEESEARMGVDSTHVKNSYVSLV